MASPQTKDERINLRLKRSAKDLLERAATVEGKTVSNYILSSALGQAEKTVYEHGVMRLSQKESEAFFDAFAAPARFNRKIAAAVKEHDRRITSK